MEIFILGLKFDVPNRGVCKVRFQCMPSSLFLTMGQEINSCSNAHNTPIQLQEQVSFFVMMF
jgi:hypothetical protein